MIATVTHAVELVLVFVPNVFPPMFLQAESVLPLVPLKIAPLAVVPAQQPAPSVILDSSLTLFGQNTSILISLKSQFLDTFLFDHDSLTIKVNE